MSAASVSSASASSSAAAAADADSERMETEESDEADEQIANALSSADADSAKDQMDLVPGGVTLAAPPAHLSALEKLEFILRQTDQFSRVVGSKALKEARDKAKERKNRHRNEQTRKSEEEEDAELVKDESVEDDEAKEHYLIEQPPSIKGEMREYQLEALNWLIRMHDQKINGILADEMGLGKTLESLSLLSYLKSCRNYAGPHLIIVPKSTLNNWLREVNRWTPNLTSMKFHGTQEERAAALPQLGKCDITATTYEIAIREKSAIRKINWRYIYIDEAHRIKNENSLLATVVRTFPSEHRLLLTGTPLQNNLHELWALLNFLVPQLFGSAADFEHWFDFSDPEQRGSIVTRLHKLLRPFLLRRMKSEVEKSMPPKFETKLFIGLSAMQRSWYTKLLSRDLDVLNAKSATKMRLLNLVMQLRKVCNHPYLFNGAEVGPPYLEGPHIVENSGKMILLDKLLKKFKQRGSRVLIFSQMTRMLDILEDYLRMVGYEYCRIDGQSKQDERDEAMDTFNAPGSSKFCFLLSTRAGGLGINLQTADIVILFDSDWNPQMDLQAMDRAHRIGQKKPVFVYRFVTENTLEQKIIERASKKLFLDQLVIKQGKLVDADQSVSAAELQAMVRHGASHVFSGTDSTITDADIDAILERGEKLTADEKNKLKELTEKGGMNTGDLLNFSLFDSTEHSTFEFEGKDYSGIRKAAGMQFIEPPRRERKGNYDIDKYYRNALKAGARMDDERKLEKLKATQFKPTQRYEYQFYSVERLEELERKDFESRLKLAELKLLKKIAEKKEKRLQAEQEREQRREQKRQQRLREKAAEKAASAAGGNAADGADNAMAITVKVDSVAGAESAAPSPSPSPSPSPTPYSSVAPSPSPTSFIKQEDAMEIDKSSSSSSSSAAAADPLSAFDGDFVAVGDALMERRRSSRARAPPAPAAAAAEEKKDESDAEEEAEQETEQKEGEENEEGELGGADDLAKEDPDLLAQAGCLSREERRELEQLLRDGFGNWARRHFQSFVRACERYGRNAIDQISTSVEGKTPDEVRAYHATFFQRFHEMKDAERIEAQIARGEKRLEEEKRMEQVVQWKVGKLRNPYQTMKIEYPSANKISRSGYTEDEDRFLLLTVSRLGYGRWDELRAAISRAWLFRFDWFLKSRTPGELSRRVDHLVKLLSDEKEKEDAKLKEKAKRDKAKAKAGAGAGSASKKKGAAAASTPQKKRKAPASTPTKKGAGSSGKKAAASPNKKAKLEASEEEQASGDDDDDDMQIMAAAKSSAAK